MSVNNMVLVNCGSLEMDKSIMTAGSGFGNIIYSPVYAAIIKTNIGLVLVDTGLNPNGISNPKNTWGSRTKTVKPKLTDKDIIINRIEEVGYSLKDIKYVINTHLHWDHTGGNLFFEDCPIIVQKSEYRFALYPDNNLKESYMDNHYNFPLNYQLIEGDMELLPGINIISSPGHTPGHQSVMVDLKESGKIILAGDSVYCNDNIEKIIPPGNCWDTSIATDSIKKLNLIKRLTNSTLLPGHEPSLWEHFKPYPNIYR